MEICMILKLLWYVIIVMFIFLAPQFNYSLSGMVANMREKALIKAGEPWPEPCFDWSNTRMPIEEQKQWKNEYTACNARNRNNHNRLAKSVTNLKSKLSKAK